MKLKDVKWRAMSGYDVATIHAIAAVVHPGFFETPQVLAERQRLYPTGAHLLEVNDRPVGYVLSHPWRLGTLPALNSLLGTIPADADTYYVHDLALLPLARGIGAAAHIVKALSKHAKARGFTTMSLIAVNASQGFWETHGFAVEHLPALTQKLLSYEPSARFMVKR